MPDWLTVLNREVIACTRCPRLVAYREQIARDKRAAFRDWDYWGKPVPGFGDPDAWLLVVGLAPAAHGGNRTGRVFPGDRSVASHRLLVSRVSAEYVHREADARDVRPRPPRCGFPGGCLTPLR